MPVMACMLQQQCCAAAAACTRQSHNTALEYSMGYGGGAWAADGFCWVAVGFQVAPCQSCTSGPRPPLPIAARSAAPWAHLRGADATSLSCILLGARPAASLRTIMYTLATGVVATGGQHFLARSMRRACGAPMAGANAAAADAADFDVHHSASAHLRAGSRGRSLPWCGTCATHWPWRRQRSSRTSPRSRACHPGAWRTHPPSGSTPAAELQPPVGWVVLGAASTA